MEFTLLDKALKGIDDVFRTYKQEISIGTYALYSLFCSVFLEPRMSFLLLPLIMVEFKRNYDASEKVQMGYTKYYMDNFLYDSATCMVWVCVILNALIYCGRNGIANLKVSSQNSLQQSAFYFICTFLLNLMSYLYGFTLSKFLPNPNSSNKKIIYKMMIAFTIILTMFPLANVSKIRLLENFYVSTFFMAACGFIDGSYCVINPRDKDAAFYISLTKIIAVFYLFANCFITAKNLYIPLFLKIRA
ncbi:hypothetical protein EDEG_03558 [Edhazardia aedis USNM 41457]|uniref:Uncharacterized protein n=1 Tax=Edhazardia aedis (strain USNM 41457) TaxID=1003232 RepID=J9D2C1_EDHAE|nr:hypothetical protein EDEG_03558 [Edhazardia aedis USNM 41457]|eukprot:EJW01986.1 hypothetical protein EDEG_03558 [Edhazardia aedis USNM 41457]